MDVLARCSDLEDALKARDLCLHKLSHAALSAKAALRLAQDGAQVAEEAAAATAFVFSRAGVLLGAAARAALRQQPGTRARTNGASDNDDSNKSGRAGSDGNSDNSTTRADNDNSSSNNNSNSNSNDDADDDALGSLALGELAAQCAHEAEAASSRSRELVARLRACLEVAVNPALADHVGHVRRVVERDGGGGVI